MRSGADDNQLIDAVCGALMKKKKEHLGTTLLNNEKAFKSFWSRCGCDKEFSKPTNDTDRWLMMILIANM